MSEMRDDEFYIGYLPRAPRGVGRRARLGVIAAFVAAVTVALVLVAGQSPFGPGVFEFGVRKELVGVIREKPYPMLLVPRPGDTGDQPRFSTYYLTRFGKHGAGPEVAGLDGQPVRLAGSLIYRDDRTMVEIEAGSVERLAGAAAAAMVASRPLTEETLGTQTLVGEIVDSKCYLGVMKPGNLKPHRSCAARCISGGVPPVLLVRDAQGRATYFLLVSRDGAAVNRQVLDVVAEPVEITGQVVRQGDILILLSDPSTYRRLPA